jgi:acyl-CoA thioester hydrolase
VSEFLWPVRVYYEDTDIGGVVYHANFLKFMERARTEWLRDLGYQQDDLQQAGIVFAVHSASLEFLRPGRFNESLEVSVVPVRCGPASLTFAQEVRRASDAEVLCRAQVKIACVDFAFRPRPIPTELRMEIRCEH